MRPHDHLPTALDEVLEDSHLAISLLAGTLVASPVLVAAFSGRQPVSSALGLYLAAIVGAWVVVGLLGGALSLAGRRPIDGAAGGSAEPLPPSPAADDPAVAGDPVVADPAAGEPVPVTATR